MNLATKAYGMLLFATTITIACSADPGAEEESFEVRGDAVCPAISPPGPDFCPDGYTKTIYDGDCVVAYVCAECPAISPPDPAVCAGYWQTIFDGSCVIAYFCNPAVCAPISPPGADFCPNGEVQAIFDNQCVIAYVCNECPAACQELQSCVDHCGGAAPSGACFCDDLCDDYGDCCGDFASACGAP